MSEVKRYHVTEAGLVEGEALGRINVVLGSDYDVAVAVGTAFGNTLERVVAERDALQQRLTAADERADRLEADKRAMTETHILYTWLRKKCDQPSNDVVVVNMNIGHDWVPVHDLDRDLRSMIDREEP